MNTNKILSFKDILIIPELKDLIPPLTTEEKSNLEQSILQEGCHTNLMIWERTENEKIDYVLVDGHNRFEICLKHKIDFGYNIKYFADMDEAKQWMFFHQQSRRNLNKLTKSYLIGQEYNLLKKSKADNFKAEKTEETTETTAQRLANKYKESESTIKRYAGLTLKLDDLKKRNKDLYKKVLQSNISFSDTDIIIDYLIFADVMKGKLDILAKDDIEFILEHAKSQSKKTQSVKTPLAITGKYKEPHTNDFLQLSYNRAKEISQTQYNGNIDVIYFENEICFFQWKVWKEFDNYYKATYRLHFEKKNYDLEVKDKMFDDFDIMLEVIKKDVLISIESFLKQYPQKKDSFKKLFDFFGEVPKVQNDTLDNDNSFAQFVKDNTQISDKTLSEVSKALNSETAELKAQIKGLQEVAAQYLERGKAAEEKIKNLENESLSLLENLPILKYKELCEKGFNCYRADYTAFTLSTFDEDALTFYIIQTHQNKNQLKKSCKEHQEIKGNLVFELLNK